MKKHAGFLLITSLFLLLLSCQSKSPESPEPLWIFRADLPLLFLQNIDEERLGVKSADAFFILDKASGEVLHRYAPPGFGVSGALLEDNRLYYGGSDYYFRCTDVLKQKELWKIRTRSINEAAPLLDERSVYWGSGDSTVYAVDKHSGRLRWQYKTGSHIRARPILVDSMLIIGSWDTRLYALHRESGQKLWQFQAGAAVEQTPVLVQGSLWLPNYDYHIYRIDLLTGEGRSVFTAMNAFEFGGTHQKDTLIFSGIDRFFYFVDPFAGEVNIRGKSAVAISTSPAVAGNTLFTGQYDGGFYHRELPGMAETLLHRFDDRVIFILSDGHYVWAASWDRSVVCFSLNKIP